MCLPGGDRRVRHLPAGGAVGEDGAMKVALMVTCVNDAMFPDAGKAVVTLLRRLGVDVEFPEAQTCCAQPMVNTGYLDEAVPVVRTFVDAFAGYDAVVTPSGSCAGSVRHQHSIVARRSGDPALARKVERDRAAGPRADRVPRRRAGRRGRRRVVPAPGHLPPHLPLAAAPRRRGPPDPPAARRTRPASWWTCRWPRSAAASAGPSRSRTPTCRWRWAPTRPATCARPAPRCWSRATTPASCTSAGCSRASSPGSGSCTSPRCWPPPRVRHRPPPRERLPAPGSGVRA